MIGNNLRGGFFGALLAFTAFFPHALYGEEADTSVPGRTRTQEISLQAGWNAVFLEVDPLNPSPAAVFGALPVEQVATFFPGTQSTQFVTDPSADLRQSLGWGVWYAANRPEAFLKSLDAIHGNQGYLIKATRAHQWKVRGVAKALKYRWQPDSYNLVGVPVIANGGPTFQEFFAGSKAHAQQAIYRLVNNSWKKVAQPSAETMRPGEGFWIFCKGSSDYQGPLRVELPLEKGMVLGSGRSGLIFRNETTHPVSALVEQVTGEGQGLPLSILVTAIGDPAAPLKALPVSLPRGAWAQQLPSIEQGASISLPFECRAAELLLPLQGSLLKITSDLGTVTWVPVQAARDGLAE
jgi:hypothetical protein